MLGLFLPCSFAPGITGSVLVYNSIRRFMWDAYCVRGIYSGVSILYHVPPDTFSLYDTVKNHGGHFVCWTSLAQTESNYIARLHHNIQHVDIDDEQ